MPDYIDAKRMQVVKEQLNGYELSERAMEQLDINMASYASARIANHFQEAANTVLSRMKDRQATCLLCLCREANKPFPRRPAKLIVALNEEQ